MKLAYAHPHYSRMVVTQQGLRTRDEALLDGYTETTPEDFYAAMAAPAPVVAAPVAFPPDAPLGAPPRKPSKLSAAVLVEGSTPSPKAGEVARHHDTLPHFVTLPDGRLEGAVQALRAGWKIEGTPLKPIDTALALGLKGEHAAEHAAGVQQAFAMVETDEARVYLRDVMALPEAQGRPLAAARMGAAYNHRTMPLDRARAFLRGLPPETGDATGAPTYAPRGSTFNRRRYDLFLLGVERKVAHGDEEARKTLDACRYAEAVHRAGCLSLPDSLRAVGVDPARFDGGADV